MITVRTAIGLRKDEGSFTLEASLVFPVLFLVTVLFIFVGLTYYQSASLYVSAGLTAERAAYSWDNSYKNSVSGSYPFNQYDGLYWRTFEDSGSDMFGFIIRNAPSSVALQPSEGDPVGRPGSLPEKKLLNAAVHLQGQDTKLSYTNHFVKRQIKVVTNDTIALPLSIETIWNGNRIQVEAISGVVEPVEFIRNIDLIRTYMPVLKKHMDKLLARNPKNGTNPNGGISQLAFPSEPEARRYLQRQVGGKETWMTVDGGGRRKIDALDSDGVAHQAYVGYIPNRKTADENGDRFNEQLSKDAALLKSGQVKAVVWHFYKNENTGKIGPSRPLVKELERNGIIVVIHYEDAA